MIYRLIGKIFDGAGSDWAFSNLAVRLCYSTPEFVNEYGDTLVLSIDIQSLRHRDLGVEDSVSFLRRVSPIMDELERVCASNSMGLGVICWMLHKL